LFLGETPHYDLAKIYNGADVFVFASTTETQGLVIPEAMSCGLCVLTVQDRVYEQFIENGVDGFMVDKTEDKFVQKLEEILDNKSLREQVCKQARIKAEKFSLEDVAKKFESLYESLL
jgi:glycosyltransferase involved in cell wall biosynthesis